MGKNKGLGRSIALLLALVMVFGMNGAVFAADSGIVEHMPAAGQNAAVSMVAPFSAAETPVNIGTVTTSQSGANWEFKDNTLYVGEGANIVITGTATGRNIEVTGNATITLNNASVTMNEPNSIALLVDSDATLTLNLIGTNTLSAQEAGIESRGSVTIIGPGILNTSGGWSGIIATDYLEITGGAVVNAFGEIGIGCVELVGNIIIDGATVNAIGRGGGSFLVGIIAYNLTIENGSVVTATGEDVSAVIFAETAGILALEEITIESGASVIATGGEAVGDYSKSAGMVATAITIGTGTTVTATGGRVDGSHGDSFGISAWGAITIERGARVIAIGHVYAILSGDTPVVNNSIILGSPTITLPPTYEGIFQFRVEYYIVTIAADDPIASPPPTPGPSSTPPPPTRVPARRVLIYDGTTNANVITHTVTFNFNYAGAPANFTRQYVHGSITNPPPAVSDRTGAGYHFHGWQRGTPTGPITSFPFIVNAPLTFYANWQQQPLPEAYRIVVNPPRVTVRPGTQVSFTASFFDSSGNPIASQSVTWDVNGNQSPDTHIVSGNSGILFIAIDETATELEIVARSILNPTVSGDAGATVVSLSAPLTGEYVQPTTPLSHNIIYHPNGGEGYAITDTVSRGGSHTVRPANTFTHENYTFTGWNTRADGSGTAFEPGFLIQNVTSNMRLYAQWSLLTIIITIEEDTAEARIFVPGEEEQIKTVYLPVWTTRETYWQIEAEGIIYLTIPHALLLSRVDEDIVITLTAHDAGAEHGANQFIFMNISVTVGGEETSATAVPFTIAKSLSNFDLTGLNTYRIVARFRNPALIGGIYNRATGLMTFEAQAAGALSITYVETLNRLTMGLDSHTIYDLAGNAPTQHMDVLPFLQNGRTLVPIRFVAQALGAEADWRHAEDGTILVFITQNGVTLTIPIGELTPQLAALGMDVPAQLTDERTMLPLRFVSEFFGALVSWDSETRSIEILRDSAR